MEAKYKIGTQYMTRGRYKKLCTVSDILKTYNHKGELVSIRYVSLHSFMGQVIADYDVVDATITNGLLLAA